MLKFVDLVQTLEKGVCWAPAQRAPTKRGAWVGKGPPPPPPHLRKALLESPPGDSFDTGALYKGVFSRASRRSPFLKPQFCWGTITPTLQFLYGPFAPVQSDFNRPWYLPPFDKAGESMCLISKPQIPSIYSTFRPAF